MEIPGGLLMGCIARQVCLLVRAWEARVEISMSGRFDDPIAILLQLIVPQNQRLNNSNSNNSNNNNIELVWSGGRL